MSKKIKREWNYSMKAWSFKLSDGSKSGCYTAPSKAYAGIVFTKYNQLHQRKKSLSSDDLAIMKPYCFSSLTALKYIGSTEKKELSMRGPDGRVWYREGLHLKKGSLAYKKLIHLRKEFEKRRTHGVTTQTET